MEIGKIVATGQSTLNADALAAPAWRLGDILQAKVIDRSAAGEVQLEIGSSQISARTDLQLRQGQQLRLRVIFLGETPQLQLLDQTADDAEVLQNALRKVLPRQGAIDPFLHIVERFQAQTTHVPSTIRQAAQRLLSQLPVFDAKQMNARTVKNALFTSGLFLEANLAQGASSGGTLLSDFKAGLLRLAEAVQSHLHAPTAIGDTSLALPRSVPPDSSQRELTDLAHYIDAALAKVELNQLQALLHERNSHPLYVVDIPVHIDEELALVHMRIEEDATGQENTNLTARYTVSLSFTLKALGTIHARLAMFATGISASLWAEEKRTLHLMEQELTHLHQSLTDVGVATLHINCYAGAPPVMSTPSTAPLDLVDVHV